MNMYQDDFNILVVKVWCYIFRMWEFFAIELEVVDAVSPSGIDVDSSNWDSI